MFDYKAAIQKGRREWRDHGPTMLQVVDDRATFLEGTDGNVTSQFGEDGVLAALFEKIGITNRRCFEVGANNGQYLSNTWALRESGWSAILIEVDGVHFETLIRTMQNGSAAINAKVTKSNIDTILGSTPLEMSAPDLGIIDIDGEDLKVWAGMKDCRPRVLLVEFNGKREDGPTSENSPWQTGLRSTLQIAEAKGYVALATLGVNVLFLDAKESYRLDR